MKKERIIFCPKFFVQFGLTENGITMTLDSTPKKLNLAAGSPEDKGHRGRQVFGVQMMRKIFPAEKRYDFS